MKTLLVVNASGRITRSITRHLTDRFARAWEALHPDGTVITRDIGSNPPPCINEAWIAAAFANPKPTQTPEALVASEELIDEITRADVIVFGTPIYNYGMPAQLKAYIDQVVRIGRTVAFDPYRPLVESKPVVIITSAGDGAIHPGGELAHMNHLEPHLQAVLSLIGLTDLRFVRVGYDKFQDDRTRRSLASAEKEIDQLVEASSSGLALPC